MYMYVYVCIPRITEHFFGSKYLIHTLMYSLCVCVSMCIGDSEEVKGIGSVSGGGRYDELVNMFDPKGPQVNNSFCTCVSCSSC